MSNAHITARRSRSFTYHYKVVHFLSIDNVKSRMASLETVTSECFQCANDLNRTKFTIRIGFGETDEGKWISGYLFSENRDVFVQECTMTITAACSKKQFTISSFPNRVVDSMTGYGSGILLDEAEFSTLDDELFVRTEFLFNSTYSSTRKEAMVDFLSFRDLSFDADLLKLFSDATDADVTIVVGKKTFKAHKSLLKARSKYFRTLFESGMAEARTNEVLIVDADPEVFKHYLEFLYTGYPPRPLIEEAWELLPLADRFGALSLKNKCEGAIMQDVSASNAIKALSLAHAHCCFNLIDKCLPLIRNNLKSLKATVDWKEMRNNAHLVALVLESYAQCN